MRAISRFAVGWPVRGALVLFALCAATPARADADAELDLTWQAPPSCPNAGEVRDAILDWIDQPSNALDTGALRVDARVERDATGYRLTLELESPSGEAEENLHAKSCSTLVEVVALKVALAANPGQTLAKLDSRVVVSARGLHASLRLTGGAVVGQVPEVAASIAVAGAMSWSSTRIELGVSYTPPRAAHYSEFPSVGADIEQAAAGARACGIARLGSAELPLCAGAELGLMRGSGFGVERSSSSSQLAAAIVLGPALRWPVLGQLWAFAGIDALVAVVRPSFHMRNLTQLYRPDPVAARAALGVELDFE